MRLFLLFLGLLVSTGLFAQGLDKEAKFFLENGAIYIGKILKESEQQYVIETSDGNRLRIKREDIDKLVLIGQDNEILLDSLSIPKGFIEFSAGLNGNESDLGANYYRFGMFRGFRFKNNWFAGAGGSVRVHGANTFRGYTMMSLEANLRYYFSSGNKLTHFVAINPGVLLNIDKNFRGEGLAIGLHGGWALELLNETPFFIGGMLEVTGTGFEHNMAGGLSLSIGI